MNIKMTMSYDGSKYYGFQRLKKQELTIQGKIEKVLSEYFGKAIEINGSGRTDKGVHAVMQVANFKVNDDVDLVDLKVYLRRYLPEDIVIYDLEEANDRFHARLTAKGKVYEYRIERNLYGSPFDRKYVTVPFYDLDVLEMRDASTVLVGEHDFRSFTNAKTKKSTVRTIDEIKIEEQGSMVIITISGNGFLHNMVRIIVGSLLEVGSGRMNRDELERALLAKKREIAGPMAPAKGLFLEKVLY